MREWGRLDPMVLRCQTLIALKRQIKPMPTARSETASFRALSQATPSDWKIIERAEREYRLQHGPGRGLLMIMASIANIDPQGVPVNLYTHCLQTATRVLKAGRDDELVVVALFHDLTEAFSDNHHGLLAAEMLAPCATFDLNSFDPDYPTLPLEAFEPIVLRFFSGPVPERK